MRHLHPYLALVVIDLLNDALISAKSNALDGVTLSLPTAGLNDFSVFNRFSVDLDLALHHIACLKNWRLEAVGVVELDTSEADRVAVLEKEDDLSQLRYLLPGVPLQLFLRWPLEADLIVRNVCDAPQRQLAKTDFSLVNGC